jgi:hypothetical protein
MVNEKFYQFIRRLRLRLNRFRVEYQLRRKNKHFKIVIPERHREKIKFFKYLSTTIALLSAFIIFTSAWVAFVFGCVVYLISLLLEKTAFAHTYAFIHPLPDFELDPDKWIGVGFGYAVPPDGKYTIPLVSMMITDLEYAKKLESLFLKWTGGNYVDESKNVQIICVVTKPKEYIFLCYPSPKRPIAQRFFQSARDKLRSSSLVDEVSEHHLTLVLGKRCEVGEGSYFPTFRSRYRSGIPVAFEFILPPFDQPKATPGIPAFTFFDFSIKEKTELTRKDFAYDAIWSFKRGGKWQGPDRETK